MSHNYEAQRRETFATFKGARGLPERAVVEFIFFVEETDADWAAFEAGLKRKGFRKIYGQAQDRLVDFWAHFGAKPLGHNRKITFSDFSYTEMLLDMAAA